MITYSAIINRRHIPDFLTLFYELESSRGAEVKIIPDDTQTRFDNYLVKITVKDETWVEILMQSFNEGLLHHQGWGAVFSLNLPHEQPSHRH